MAGKIWLFTLDAKAGSSPGADFVDRMTPTFAGTVLLDASIKPGDLLEVKTNTPPHTFTSYPQSDGSVINVVDGGTATITLDPQDTILVPNITLDDLQLIHRPWQSPWR